METTSKTIEHEVTWSRPTEVELQMKHVTLPDTLTGVMRGIEQSVSGESVEIDPDELPVDDDDA